MTLLRVMICDDEPLAVDRLSDLLEQCSAVAVVGRAYGGQEVLDQVEQLRPDLILLDVEMPRLDGFDVVEALHQRTRSSAETVPLICFVTAYPRFATEAFETGALDFLSKPVRLPRLEKAIGRARAAVEQREAAMRLRELSGQLEALRRNVKEETDRALWLHHGGETVRVDIPSLDWIEAEGEYVRLHQRERSFLFRNSVHAMADELAPYGFVRIHRSAVINAERLVAVKRTRGGGMTACLSIGIELPVGRKFREAIDRLTVPKV